MDIRTNRLGTKRQRDIMTRRLKDLGGKKSNKLRNQSHLKQEQTRNFEKQFGTICREWQTNLRRDRRLRPISRLLA